MTGVMLLRKLLNTLYITSPEAHLGRDGENIVVRIDDEVRFRIPIHNLESVVTFGYVGASPSLMYLCAERGVALSFLSPSGRLRAKMATPTKGNVLLRRRQYYLSDDEEETLDLARNFVFGKLHNCRSVLRRYLRDYSDSAGGKHVGSVVTRLSIQLEKLLNVNDLDALRGIEGEGARTYYEVFNHLILESKEDFYFGGRSRRPPLDLPNAVLSFLYSLLAHDCTAALETVGLDPQVGFLHRIRPGRNSLALDLMEELRPYLVDRLTLTLINNRQINAKDFIVKESGAVLLNDEGRKKVIDAWQTRKQQLITHPYMQERIELGLIAHAQAMLLARCIRGDLEAYPPFLWK
jgi:CRISPR-associated protein Cas1